MTTTEPVTVTLTPEELERITRALGDHADIVRIPPGIGITLGEARERRAEVKATDTLRIRLHDLADAAAEQHAAHEEA